MKKSETVKEPASMNIFKKIINKIGEATGSTAKELANGTYKGITGKTDEDIQKSREQREYNSRLRKNYNKISQWIFMMFVSMIVIITGYLLYDSGFSANEFYDNLEKRWILYIIPAIIAMLLNSFKDQISKEITR